MLAAKKPFDAALALEVLCSASPLAVRAVYGSESVFDYKSLMLEVNLVVTAIADKVSGIELLRFGGICSDGRVRAARCTVLAIPFDGHFVVQLRGSDFDGIEHPLFTVPLDGVVRRVALDHRLHLLRHAFSQSNDKHCSSLICLPLTWCHICTRQGRQANSTSSNQT